MQEEDEGGGAEKKKLSASDSSRVHSLFFFHNRKSQLATGCMDMLFKTKGWHLDPNQGIKASPYIFTQESQKFILRLRNLHNRKFLWTFILSLATVYVYKMPKIESLIGQM